MSALEKISNEGQSSMCKPLNELKEAILSNVDKNRIAIFMHSNPDPDSIGAALGVEKILKSINADIKCTLVYSGEISHPQNKTLLNVLGIIMTHVSEIDDLATKFDHFIVVDSIPERSLAEDLSCLLTIDHHRNDTERSKIVDIREVGAASSMVWEYLKEANLGFQEGDESDTKIATALLIGIKTDTGDLISENVTDLDHKAHFDLMEYVDRRQISMIINYPIPPYRFELEQALHKEGHLKIENGVLVGGVGFISPSKRDALPMMADTRQRTEGIETAFIFGVVGDNIEVSVRSQGISVDVNALCQKIFGKKNAGGKQGAGAGKIPLGFLGVDSNTPDDIKEKMWDAIAALAMDKIFHVMNGNG